MPVPEHLLMTFRGHMGTAATARETWSFGLRFADSAAGNAVGTTAMQQQLVQDAKAAFGTVMTTTAARISSHCFFDEVRGYQIGTDGKAKSAPVLSTGPTIQGVGASPLIPWQNTVAVTLDAGFPSKGRFGRFYLPTPSLAVDDTGLIDLTLSQAMLPVIKTFLESVSNLPQFDTGYGLVVVGSTGASGTKRTVQNIRLGRAIDTQRRRRRQIDENYIVTSFSA